MDPAGSAPVTAVIPLYNYEQFIAATIDSVLAQSVPYEKVIVVNDGSTDGSLAVAMRYADKVTVVDQPNQGQIGASLSVLGSVTSKYVHFVDADDLLGPRVNEALLPYFKGDYAKIQFMLQGIDDKGAPTNSLFPTFPPHYDAAAMREDCRRIGFYTCPPTTGNVYSKRFLDSLDRRLFNPRDFTDGTPALLAPFHGEIACVRQPLGCYRVHGRNVSSWDRPSPQVLAAEADMFRRRWREAVALRPGITPPAEHCNYLEERRLYARALTGAVPPRQALDYIGSLAGVRMGVSRRLAMAMAALAFVVLPAEPRRKIIFALRSPLNRSAWINSALVWVRRARLRTSHA